MTKKLKVWLAALASLFILINIPVQVSAYQIDSTYNQLRSSMRTNNRFIILHETGPSISMVRYVLELITLTVSPQLPVLQAERLMLLELIQLEIFLVRHL